MLNPAAAARVVAFRQHRLLPLEDWLSGLQETLPDLTGSTRHGGLQRHGIRRLPQVSHQPAKQSRFKAYPIGYFQLDMAQVQTEDGKRSLFVALERPATFAFAARHARMT